ncbi:hypothetical protein CBR20_15815 [Cronobacter sakazakii]|nr:hypothetical protein [Cronobacter sakazakii]EGZ6869888.1 hypothetical protein [Cronobacter sakazakii]KAB0805895.1 hypothetical protein FZI15_21380 [Cronobacter sakazakii]KAB0818947.1 hypothetical protein FZI44_18885 [Cronobacter sakazakii]KAB0846673.1 hypothetical protein FZI10_20705 [Cronobacter sakazakii]
MSVLIRWEVVRPGKQSKRRPDRRTGKGFKAQWTSKMRHLMRCGKRMLLSFIASCMISGCVIKAPKTGVLFCDGANPIFVSKDDFMTEQTEREILLHNMMGERLCKWE